MKMIFMPSLYRITNDSISFNFCEVYNKPYNQSIVTLSSQPVISQFLAQFLYFKNVGILFISDIVKLENTESISIEICSSFGLSH